MKERLRNIERNGGPLLYEVETLHFKYEAHGSKWLIKVTSNIGRKSYYDIKIQVSQDTITRHGRDHFFNPKLYNNPRSKQGCIGYFRRDSRNCEGFSYYYVDSIKKLNKKQLLQLLLSY